MEYEDHPMTIKNLARRADCSLSTVYRALRKRQVTHYCIDQPKGNAFYMIIMPWRWSRTEAKAYADSRCKNGKSRAKIYSIGKRVW